MVVLPGASFVVGWLATLNMATAGKLEAVPVLNGHGFEIIFYHVERGRFTSRRQRDEVPRLTGKTEGAARMCSADAIDSRDRRHFHNPPDADRSMNKTNWYRLPLDHNQ